MVLLLLISLVFSLFVSPARCAGWLQLGFCCCYFSFFFAFSSVVHEAQVGDPSKSNVLTLTKA